MKSKVAKLYAIRHSPLEISRQRRLSCLWEGLLTGYTLYAILAGCLLFTALGCESADDNSAQLQPQKPDLEAQIAQLQADNEQLQNQIKHLLDLGPEATLEYLVNVEKIVITRRSGLYDKDKDGKKEKLIVYVRPIDSEDDIIKAPGTVRVRLLDLDREPKQMLLQERVFGPGELKKLWVGTFMTGYYRLILNVDEEFPDNKELTVKADFTDYLTGKVHTAQKVILPR